MSYFTKIILIQQILLHLAINIPLIAIIIFLLFEVTRYKKIYNSYLSLKIEHNKLQHSVRLVQNKKKRTFTSTTPW